MGQEHAMKTAQRQSKPDETALASERAASPWDPRAILIGLMVPMGMTVLNLSMFSVAVPFIRDSFQVNPDTAAWLVTSYTLPFVMFMPLYGRLGDGLGKRRLFTIGIVIFLVGTLMCLLSPSLPWLFAGRVVQGIGTAGVNPLCIAIISELFPDSERGRALGTWSSTGPATAMFGPFIGGFLVDQFGWHTIFLPGIMAAFIALYVVRGYVPKLEPKPQPGFLRNFDWLGMLLLGSAIAVLIGYLSSRSITGVEPLRDWRLALATVALFTGFIAWERRHLHPLIQLSLFQKPDFGRATFTASMRMFLMSSQTFLIPLYLTDIYGLRGMTIGFMTMMQAGSLLTTVRLGGRLSDGVNRRWPVIIGFLAQIGAMFYFASLSDGAPLWSMSAGLVAHGLGAGVSLAVLHRSAMDDVPAEDAGGAAGLYSMSRFFGNIVGATLGGVILTQALQMTDSLLMSYNIGFLFTGCVGILGIIVFWGVRPNKPAVKTH